jgi:hypothetical protein
VSLVLGRFSRACLSLSRDSQFLVISYAFLSFFFDVNLAVCPRRARCRSVCVGLVLLVLHRQQGLSCLFLRVVCFVGLRRVSRACVSVCYVFHFLVGALPLLALLLALAIALSLRIWISACHD